MIIIYKAKDHKEEEYQKSKTELMINAIGDTAKATGRFAGKVFKIVIWTSVIITAVGGIIFGVTYYKIQDELKFQTDLYNAFNGIDSQNSKYKDRIDKFMNSIKKNNQTNCLKAKELIMQVSENELIMRVEENNFGVFNKFRECVRYAQYYQNNRTQDNLNTYQNSLNTLKSNNKCLGDIIEGWYDQYIKLNITQ